MNKKELQEMALKQIKQDLSSNDEEAIVELLSFVPTENLLGFLSEDEQNIFKLEIAIDTLEEVYKLAEKIKEGEIGSTTCVEHIITLADTTLSQIKE